MHLPDPEDRCATPRLQLHLAKSKSIVVQGRKYMVTHFGIGWGLRGAGLVQRRF